MRRWLLAMLGVLLLFPGGRAAAHDLGFRTVTFEELEEGRYQLKYIARPGGVESQGYPRLSEGLTWEQEPGLPDGLMKLAFNVDGRKLSNDDRIFLPWKTNGIMVEAFWRNGERVRRMVSYDRGKEGFDIRIGDLRAGGGGMKDAMVRFTGMGARHLVTGMGHLLCIVGLAVIAGGREWRMAGAFSAGLAVAAAAVWWMGWSPEPGMTDLMAGLTLVFVGGEVVRRFRGEMVRGGMGMAALFGGAHGLGFAAALMELGLPAAELPVNGAFFLLGGVAGGLAVVLLWVLAGMAAKAISLGIPRRVGGAFGYVLGISAVIWSVREGVRWFS